MNFSIIIPTFNAEKTVERAILSLSPGMGDYEYEILIVDDGSTDSTCRIIEKFIKQNPNIKLLRTQHNGGREMREILASAGRLKSGCYF